MPFCACFSTWSCAPLQLAGLGQVRGQSAAYRAQISTLRNENEMLARKVSDLNQHITANDGSRAAMTALQGFSVRRPSLVSVHDICSACPVCCGSKPLHFACARWRPAMQINDAACLVTLPA